MTFLTMKSKLPIRILAQESQSSKEAQTVRLTGCHREVKRNMLNRAQGLQVGKYPGDHCVNVSRQLLLQAAMCAPRYRKSVTTLSSSSI